ncbi:TadE/TadG family type IV pilus assembly protein [Citromicrobium bathyomarinum]
MNFLTRLRRNIAGNTVAIVAAALVPLVALIGSGVDMSRAYMVESRLQQACDAGVLAGRKEMGNSTWTTAAANVASEYFEVNYASDYLGSQDVSFVPTNPSGTTTVEGTASVRLPTVIMQFFTFSELNLAVDCAARYDVGNADVTFVLDTTGSMACPSDADTSQCSAYLSYYNSYADKEGRAYGSLSRTSRMSALKDAIDSFYNTLDTASAGSGGRIRYSFVPYTGTVNVGRLLPQNYIVDSHAYQSRISETAGGSMTVHRTEPVCSGFSCWWNPSAGTNCTNRYYTYHGTNIRGEYATTFSGCIWQDYHENRSTVYKQVTHPTSSYKTFTETPDPTGVTSNRYTWEGCIEERDTVASDSVTFNAGTKTFSPNGLYDLDIDSAPTNNATKWRPYWPEVVFYRDTNTTQSNTPGGRDGKPQTSCPYRAELLGTYDSLSALRSYTNNLSPDGGTYHDIGLLWGARVSSPQGIFSTTVNAAPSNNSYVGRHIVFMTDGELDPGPTYYNAYGIEQHDGRITGMQTSNSQTAIRNEQHTRLTRRYKELCKAIKAKGIRLWVVAFNTTLTTDMTECASPNSSYTANNSGALNDAFGQIAEEIADLRLVD